MRWSQWVLIVVLGASLSACGNGTGEGQDAKAKLAVPPGEVVVGADSPKKAYIKETVLELSPRPLLEPLSGRVVYDETRTARITSPIAGRVISQLTPLGTRVRTGSSLIEIDSPDLGTAQAEYAKAVADLRLAERAYQRSKALYEGKAIARKDFEQTQDDLDRAKSESERTREHLTNLQVKVGRQVSYDRFTLRAPIDGVITERNINPGMQVRPDLANPLYVISDLSHVWVSMDVFEKDLSILRVGKKVLVRVPAYAGQNFPGTVDYIGRTVDETSRTIKVRCTVPNPDGKLLPAMYATVELLSDPSDQAIVIPLTALFTEGESDWVFLALGDGRYRKQPVSVGLRLKDRAVIATGIKAGQRVVTEGALMLRQEESDEDDASSAADKGD